MTAQDFLCNARQPYSLLLLCECPKVRHDIIGTLDVDILYGLHLPGALEDSLFEIRIALSLNFLSAKGLHLHLEHLRNRLFALACSAVTRRALFRKDILTGARVCREQWIHV